MEINCTYLFAWLLGENIAPAAIPAMNIGRTRTKNTKVRKTPPRKNSDVEASVTILLVIFHFLLHLFLLI